MSLPGTRRRRAVLLRKPSARPGAGRGLFGYGSWCDGWERVGRYPLTKNPLRNHRTGEGVEGVTGCCARACARARACVRMRAHARTHVYARARSTPHHPSHPQQKVEYKGEILLMAADFRLNTLTKETK